MILNDKATARLIAQELANRQLEHSETTEGTWEEAFDAFHPAEFWDTNCHPYGNTMVLEGGV